MFEGYQEAAREATQEDETDTERTTAAGCSKQENLLLAGIVVSTAT